MAYLFWELRLEQNLMFIPPILKEQLDTLHPMDHRYNMSYIGSDHVGFLN